jgi:hypothetical protein
MLDIRVRTFTATSGPASILVNCPLNHRFKKISPFEDLALVNYRAERIVYEILAVLVYVHVNAPLLRTIGCPEYRRSRCPHLKG